MDGGAAAEAADDHSRFTVDGTAGFDAKDSAVAEGLNAPGQITAQGVGAVI
ncbi:hypothetical protein DSCOOX_48740 [Desulfosarcina ovata subsp. ovata]|uniref:Uncharacterized protein n=1 Tax=Desulfosarcina ovata subsp. ovata TaxID=2752305 RepID=A0A5K8AIX1_9BACT|nr:hypothetical protein DSCOOX_48740 [Desulfosarcina ovata subsp. ovata]